MTSSWSRTYTRHSWSSSRRRPASAARGFTLIEVVVAIGILSMVIISVFMLVTVSAASLKDSDMRNTATNIANYAIEYVRARNVTSDNLLGHQASELVKDNAHGFPGLIDLGTNPVGTTSATTYAAALRINTHPALPSGTYSGNSSAFYSSLQGYVSLVDYPNPTTPNLSSEDSNAKVDSNHKYCDSGSGVPYVIRFPLVSGPGGIKNFTALAAYNSNPKIYTTDANKLANDPNHYTVTKAGTMAYTGFRVLTQIVARKALAADPDHVQYYDVQVTVFWIVGSAEHSYSVATEIATY